MGRILQFPGVDEATQQPASEDRSESAARTPGEGYRGLLGEWLAQIVEASPSDALEETTKALAAGFGPDLYRHIQTEDPPSPG